MGLAHKKFTQIKSVRVYLYFVILKHSKPSREKNDELNLVCYGPAF